MKKRFLLLIFVLSLGIFLLLTSCGGVASTDEPGEVEEPAQTAPALPTATLSFPTSTQAVTPIPSIPEKRRLTLEFPPTIRAGDADIIRLTLEVDEMGNITPTAEVEGNEITGKTVEVPNLYDTHTIIAESRLVMAGIEILPSEMVSEPLLPGKSVTFYWSVHPSEAGQYRGTVWLYLRFVPNDGSPEPEPSTISVQTIEINATTFMGLKAGPARWLGAIGTFVSGVLGMPFFEEIVKWLWGKRKKQE